MVVHEVLEWGAALVLGCRCGLGGGRAAAAGRALEGALLGGALAAGGALGGRLLLLLLRVLRVGLPGGRGLEVARQDELAQARAVRRLSSGRVRDWQLARRLLGRRLSLAGLLVVQVRPEATQAAGLLRVRVNLRVRLGLGLRVGLRLAVRAGLGALLAALLGLLAAWQSSGGERVVSVAGDGAHLEVEPLGDGAGGRDGVDEEEAVHKVGPQQGQRADDVRARPHSQPDEGAHPHLRANVHYALGQLLHRRILEVLGQRLAAGGRASGLFLRLEAALGLVRAGRLLLSGLAVELLADEIDVDQGERLQHELHLVALAEGGELELAVQTEVVKGHDHGPALRLLLVVRRAVVLRARRRD